MFDIDDRTICSQDQEWGISSSGYENGFQQRSEALILYLLQKQIISGRKKELKLRERRGILIKNISPIKKVERKIRNEI